MKAPILKLHVHRSLTSRMLLNLLLKNAAQGATKILLPTNKYFDNKPT